MNRRTFIASTTAAVSTLALGRAAIAQDRPDFTGVTLRVHTFGGSWRDNVRDIVGKRFEETGGVAEYVVGTADTAFAKMIASRGQAEKPFDVIEMSAHNAGDWARSGFLADIDYANVPNSEELDERFRLPNLAGTSQSLDGIVWNTEKFAEMGIAEPKTYADLLDPRLKGYVSFPDITVVHALKALIGISHELGGSEEDIGPALEFVRKLDPQFFWKSAVDLLAKFQTGDVWAAPWHAGYVLRGREAGLPLSIAYPKFDAYEGVGSEFWLAIIEGTKNQRAAEYFLNQYLAPETQLAMTKAVGLLGTSPSVARELSGTPEGEVLNLEKLDKFYYPDYQSLDQADWTRQWNSIVL